MGNELTFIDFFCGAGGFSEGFRQHGFIPIMGIEKWKPALTTHNLNFGLNDKIKDVLDFEEDSEIEKLPDSHILIGSPPCVSFSLANKSGKADKSLGIRLIEAYLRVVAVKKHKKDSILIAWYMENVPNSRNFVKKFYTFADLNLSDWAIKNNKDPKEIALYVKEQGDILNSADYGSFQKRERFIAGEYIPTGRFLFPDKTVDKVKTLREFRQNFISPLDFEKNKTLQDPNYKNLKIKISELTDHFYDTGIYELDWKKAKRAKVNHPFGGYMSFPENEDKPCRTIMATKSSSTREALIFKSEYSRTGNGEYRTPTIREIASLMGFPIVYNFTGSEGTKWKQIGNAVVPLMSAALAKKLKEVIGVDNKELSFSTLIENNKNIDFGNLNTFKEKEFNNPPKRKMNSKCRRHIKKGGSITVELFNYHPKNKNIEVAKNWYIFIFSGTGKNHSIEQFDLTQMDSLKKYLQDSGYISFLNEVQTRIVNIPNLQKIQELYAEYNLNSSYLDVDSFFDLAEEIIEKYYCEELVQQDFIKNKKEVPVFQLLSLYLIGYYLEGIK